MTEIKRSLSIIEISRSLFCIKTIRPVGTSGGMLGDADGEKEADGETDGLTDGDNDADGEID
jgi:hypothetical protein